MAFTGKLVFLAITALAWFVYSVLVNNSGEATPLIIELARDAALVLSGVIVVWALEIIVVDLLVGGVWGVPSTALRRFVVYLVLGLTAAGVILKYALNVNLATLLTTSALITVVIGLAAQSTLAALFSGIALALERRIQTGDIIRVDNHLARVESIGWRSIAARRPDGTQVLVPNATIAGSPLSIFRVGEFVATELTIPAPMMFPPATIVEIIRPAVRNIAEVSADHPIAVGLNAIRLRKQLAIYSVGCFSPRVVAADNPLAGLIRLRVWYAFQRHGIAPADAAGPALPVEKIVSALANTRRFSDRSHAELEQLARAGRWLLYAPNEPVLLPADLDQAFAVLVSGELRLSDAGPTTPDGIEPPINDVQEIEQISWDAKTLLQVEAQLSEAIGPYARMAVRRAAREVADLPALYRRVAVLIENSQTRDQFLRMAPHSAVRDFRIGTAFTVWRGSSGEAPARTLVALGQVELLAIPPDRGKNVRQEIASSAS